MAKSWLPLPQRREKEKKALQSQLNNNRVKIRKQAKEYKEITNKIEMEGNSSTYGKVISDKEIEDLEPVNQELVDSNVVFRANEGPQSDFLSAPETDVLYGGSAGGGKSYAMLIDPLRYAHRKAHRALILRKTMPELKELIDTSRELYPKAFPGARYKEQEKRWLFPSGATLEFGYLDRDADVYRYQGQSYSFIGFDEITHLATEFPWQYLGSRLRTTDPEIEVYLRCTANPGGVGHNWVKKRYIDPSTPNKAFRGKDKLVRKFIPARLKDNPYLYDDGRYEMMLEALDEVSRRRLLNGDWNINDGVAFPEFIRDLHVIETFDIPNSWFRFKGADYGYTSPSSVLWLAVDPDDNTVICYRELYEKGLTGDGLGQRICDMEMGEVSSIPGVLDTSAWSRTGYTGPTIGQTLNNQPYDCKFRPADKNRVAGKIQIHERLKIGDNGRPKFQVFSTCRNLIREIETLPVSETNSEDVNTHSSDHAYDALRYALMSRPRMTSNVERMGLIKTDVSWDPCDNVFGY